MSPIAEINTAPKQKTIKPLFDRVILKVLPKEEKTKGGLYIPDSARVDYSRAQVVACGDECKVVKSGDIVMFPTELGNEIMLDEIAHKMLLERQIDAVI